MFLGLLFFFFFFNLKHHLLSWANILLLPNNAVSLGRFSCLHLHGLDIVTVTMKRRGRVCSVGTFTCKAAVLALYTRDEWGVLQRWGPSSSSCMKPNFISWYIMTNGITFSAWFWRMTNWKYFLSQGMLVNCKYIFLTEKYFKRHV